MHVQVHSRGRSEGVEILVASIFDMGASDPAPDRLRAHSGDQRIAAEGS